MGGGRGNRGGPDQCLTVIQLPCLRNGCDTGRGGKALALGCGLASHQSIAIASGTRSHRVATSETSHAQRMLDDHDVDNGGRT